MVLVDSNVLLDVLVGDPKWFGWSSQAIVSAEGEGNLAINPLIYAEVSAGYLAPGEVDAAVMPDRFVRLSFPYEAAFLAGKAFKQYRERGGSRRSPLPDFYIGAHAQIEGLTLLTRDAARYRTYFPALRLITPDDAEA